MCWPPDLHAENCDMEWWGVLNSANGLFMVTVRRCLAAAGEPEQTSLFLFINPLLILTATLVLFFPFSSLQERGQWLWRGKCTMVGVVVSWGRCKEMSLMWGGKACVDMAICDCYSLLVTFSRGGWLCKTLECGLFQSLCGRGQPRTLHRHVGIAPGKIKGK